jgi:hypothetical protein
MHAPQQYRHPHPHGMLTIISFIFKGIETHQTTKSFIAIVDILGDEIVYR